MEERGGESVLPQAPVLCLTYEMTLRIYNSYSEVFASLSWTVIHKFRQLPFNMFLKSYWFVNLALYPAKKVVLYTTFSRFKCKKFILGQAKLQSSSKGQVMDIKIWFFFLEPFQWPEFPWRWEGTDACRSSGTRMTRAHPNQIRLQWRRSSVGPNNPCLMLPRTIIMWNNEPSTF